MPSALRMPALAFAVRDHQKSVFQSPPGSPAKIQADVEDVLDIDNIVPGTGLGYSQGQAEFALAIAGPTLPVVC
jgi:hypothetical protein